MNAHPKIPEADTDTISKFLYVLFAPDFVHAFPDAWIEIVCIAPDKKLTWRFFSAHDLKPIVDYAATTNSRGYNVYVGAALRHGEKPADGERGGKKHVCAASHFWADCDDQGCYERAVDICKREQLSPAMVHITGTTPNTRAQIWIKSAQPITSIAELEAATTALRDAFGSDNVQNADRIMRIAGTVNFPTPHKTEKGYSVELTKLHKNADPPTYKADRLLALDGIAKPELSDPLAAYAAFPEQYGPKTGKSNEELISLLKQSRATSGKGWRDPMLKFIGSTVGKGWSDLQIKLACAPYSDGGVDDPDIQKEIDYARKKFGKPENGEVDYSGAGATPESNVPRPGAAAHLFRRVRQQGQETSDPEGLYRRKASPRPADRPAEVPEVRVDGRDRNLLRRRSGLARPLRD